MYHFSFYSHSKPIHRPHLRIEKGDGLFYHFNVKQPASCGPSAPHHMHTAALARHVTNDKLQITNNKFEMGPSLGISKLISMYVFIGSMIDRNQSSMPVIVFLEHVCIVLPNREKYDRLLHSAFNSCGIRK